MSVSRGAALGFAGLLALNFLEILHCGTSSADNWFCSLQPIPETLSRVLLAMAIPSFLLFAFRPALPGPVRSALLLISALLLAATARDLQLNFQSLPEAVRLQGSARQISILATLLITGIGLLATSRLRTAGSGPVGPLFLAAILTVVSFPPACILSTSVPRPLTPGKLLCLLSTPSAETAGSSQFAGLVAQAQLVRETFPDTLFVVCEPASEEGSTTPGSQLRADLKAAGVPSQELRIPPQDVDAAFPRALLEHAALKPPVKRRLAVIAPAHELARLQLLARHQGISPILLPVAGDATTAGPETILRESWLLLQQMSAPAADYIRSLRAPAETDIGFSPNSDEALDPQQLMQELQDAAAEP
ncbi:MAG: hypothetical protein RLZZ436_3727 [Planctomycetota bacterium]|jgi:hypothetical protein